MKFLAPESTAGVRWLQRTQHGAAPTKRSHPVNGDA